MPSNTSLLDTNLNIKPYFDDYDPTKQYYKILFKPSTAVQTRELNQLQTILQNQIASFGQNIFKEGSVIKGCSFTFDNKYAFVKLRDTYANGTALNVSDFNGLKVQNEFGLEATIVNYSPGLVSKNPDLNTIYIKYLNTGTYSNGSTQFAFGNNEILSFYSTANVLQGQVYSANVANVSGYGYAFTTTEGIIFKKGYFIYVTPQTTVIDKYNNVPDNISVGFDAKESLITASADDSLFDNAVGSPNYTAPGADRLKLEPQLVVKNTGSANTESFFSLVDFKEGLPITIKSDTQFESIQREVARRTYETNGDFVVKPFNIISSPLANTFDPEYTSHFNYVIEKGIGYAHGYRVEFLNNNSIKVRRSTDSIFRNNQSVSLNIGSYISVNELSGEFGNSNSILEIELHSVPKQSITNKSYLSTERSISTKIGTAFVRAFSSQSGYQGSSIAVYKVYLFDIQINSGYSFKDIRSIIYYDNGVKGVADVILDFNNNAKIQNPENNTMIFRLGAQAIKDTSDRVYSFITTSSTNLLTNGTGTLSLVSGEFLYFGNLTDSQKDTFIVIPSSTGYSTKTGTVETWTTNGAVNGTSTNFLTDYNIGDVIYTDSINRIIISISNNTFLTTDSNGASNTSGLTHKKAFIAGNPIPFSLRPRSINIDTTTSVIFNINESLDSSLPIQVTYNATINDAKPVKKILNRDIYVKIDCSTNNGGVYGPWCLGVPDVYYISGVYIGDSYNNQNENQFTKFGLLNGQTENAYGLSYLKNFSAKLTNNSKILVKMTAYTYDTSEGKGFFDISSYPVDDANTANTNAIQTYMIPTFSSSVNGFYDLRDCIDARPYASNTANVSTTISGATENPSSTVSYNTDIRLPLPNYVYRCDLDYYLKRVDRICVDINGNIVVVEGIPDAINPITPDEKKGTMTLAVARVPPYPSLTTKEAKSLLRYDSSITIQQIQNRRYTMKDIAQFDKRISNLEYYTSLSLLESTAASMQVRSSDTGLNRFQNGIFTDSFRGFENCNTLNPNFYVAIDSKRSELRPHFSILRSDFQFDSVNSTNVSRYGELILLNHTKNNPYIEQMYASKYRNCIEGNIYNYVGTIILTPNGSEAVDYQRSPDVVADIDLAQNWVNLQRAWGTQWGNWETKNITYANTMISASTSTTERFPPPPPPPPPPEDGDPPGAWSMDSDGNWYFVPGGYPNYDAGEQTMWASPWP